MLELRRWFRLPLSLLAFVCAAPLVACGYGNGGHDHYYSDDDYYADANTSCGSVEQAVIDTDEQLEVEPGVGAGAFVEYESGGTYHVTTSCDAENGGDCYWDILVTALDGASVANASAADLEDDDALTFGAGESLNLVAYTGSDFDGFSFQTEPGAAIEFDALLDGACGNRYLFWVGDGALRSGAPSNPIDFIPSAE